MTASVEGHVDIVKILIEEKAHINTQDEVCCFYCRNALKPINIIFYLHYNVGELSVYISVPQSGWTALHLAAQEGKVDVVRLLTEAKAHVNIQTEVYTHIFVCHFW